MGKPDAPAPPDPKATAAAQTGTNVSTAVANTVLGNVNQYGPNGSLEYTQNGDYSWTDPSTNETYTIPKFDATTTLTPEQQAIFSSNQQSQLGMSQASAQQSEFLRDYLGTPADFDTSAVEGRLFELGSQRLDPRFEEQRSQLEQRLANQGLTQGSAAWEAEMRNFGQNENDAYNNLLLTGRGQAQNELVAQRNQPINEITALLSGSQVSAPNYQVNQPSLIPTTDYAGIVNTNYNQQQQNYQSELGSWNSTVGGLFGLGAGGITALRKP